MCESTPERKKSAYRLYMDANCVLDGVVLHAPTVAAMMRFKQKGMFSCHAEYLEWMELSSSVRGGVWGSEGESSGSAGLRREAEATATSLIARLKLASASI